MAQLSPQDESLLSGIPTFQAAAVGGDQVLNDGTIVLWFRNDSGSPKTIQVFEGRYCDFQHAHVHHSFSVPAGSVWKTLEYDPARWNDVNGNLVVGYPSGVTSLFVAAVSQKKKFRG